MTTHPSAAPDISTERSVENGTELGGWDRISLTAAHTAVSWILAVVSLAGLYRLGQWFGTLEWLIDYKRRRRFRRALTRVLERTPCGAERRRLTREYFARARCDKLFYLIFDRIPRDQAHALFHIGNVDLLDRAVERGRGGYVALAHHGAQHVMSMLMGLHGYKTAGVRDRKESALRRFVQDRFDRLHPDFPRTRMLFADSYPREIYRCFQDGYLLGSAVDVNRVRAAHQRFEEIEVFGEKRAFLTGPLRIALRCGAPVMQAFIVPEDGFRYRLEVVQTLIDPETLTEENADITRAINEYASNVERFVRDHPALITRI